MSAVGLSVVVPVYNVEKYLDECLESLSKQITTYDYEVIIVNDGATDSSAAICKEWIQKDARFRYYEKANEGLGPTRNFGMRYSKYFYITFVDSDDWVHETYVQKMLGSILNKKADIVYCDCYYYSQMNKSLTRANFRKNLHSIEAGLAERLAFGYPNMWGAIYTKELWQRSGVEMPGIVYEDTAVYGVLLSFAKRIDYVDGALYYYRVGREGSLMQLGTKNPINMVTALKSLVNLAHEKQVYTANREALLDFCVRQLEGEWDNNIRKHSIECIQDVEREFENFLTDAFEGWEESYCQNAVAIGSYNATAIYNRVKVFREIEKNKFQFCGLLEVMSERIPENRYEFREFSSEFRRKVIEKELSQNILEQIGEKKIIILDFLEDIYDVIKVENSYLNKTDALFEAVDLLGTMEVIPRKSERCETLWKDAAKRFAEWTRQHEHQVVLLELNLCTVYGDEETRKEYSSREWIKKNNDMLKRYYKFFREICPECITVKLPMQFEYTEEKFRFGCRPYYYNSFAYYLLAYQVLKKIREGRQSDE